MIIRSLRKFDRPLSSSLVRICHKVHPASSEGGFPAAASSCHRASSTASTTTNSARFPWRHDASLPDRVLEHDDYSGEFNPTARDPPILRKLIAARELNISAWDVLLPGRHEWEVDLANSFAVAFEFAMGELFRTCFRVPVKIEDGMISFDSFSDHMGEAEQAHTTEDNAYLHGMMDKKLIKQYPVPENVQLKLKLQPIEAELLHIFAVPVPGLTREIVEDNPYLRGAIYRLHMAYDEEGFTEHYFDLLSDFARHGPDKRTVIAEAAIRCSEFFQLKDKSTGVVVQGMEDGTEEQEVIHVVRFEVVTDESQNGEERDIGNWKIVDIDDLLEGNVFH